MLSFGKCCYSIFICNFGSSSFAQWCQLVNHGTLSLYQNSHIKQLQRDRNFIQLNNTSIMFLSCEIKTIWCLTLRLNLSSWSLSKRKTISAKCFLRSDSSWNSKESDLPLFFKFIYRLFSSSLFPGWGKFRYDLFCFFDWRKVSLVRIFLCFPNFFTDSSLHHSFLDGVSLV